VLFEWDAQKAEENERKHGMSFDLARTAFGDPFVIVEIDDEHSDDELRERLLGMTSKGLVIFVTRERRSGQTFRIISARKANGSERVKYEKAAI
jgi:uncharacterized DUF497 family protein